MFVARHLPCLKAFEQTTPDKAAQDAFAYAGLHLSQGIHVHAGGRAEDDTRHRGLGVSISTAIAGPCGDRLKHPVVNADKEVHMLVEAGAEAVDEGDGADVQSAALSTLAAPRLPACRGCSITRRKIRSIMPSTVPSRCMK